MRDKFLRCVSLEWGQNSQHEETNMKKDVAGTIPALFNLLFQQKTMASKVMMALLAAAPFLGASSEARASTASNTIKEIAVEGTQVARIRLNGSTITGRPACHNAAYTTHYAFDISTAKGKALLSTLEAAMLAGKTVTVNYVSTGTCTTLAGTGSSGDQLETLDSLVISQ